MSVLLRPNIPRMQKTMAPTQAAAGKKRMIGLIDILLIIGDTAPTECEAWPVISERGEGVGRVFG